MYSDIIGFFVKYNITEFPVDPDAPNVDISGNTWEFYYNTGVEPPEITGSGLLYPSGYEAGKPDCYDLAVEISGNAKIKANRLGMSDVQLAVRLRRKPGMDPTAVFTGPKVFIYNIPDKIS